MSASPPRESSRPSTRPGARRPAYTLTLLDEEGIVRYQSPSVEQILGYRPDELLGGRWFERIHEQDRAPLLTHFSAFVESGDERARWLVRFRNSSGTFCPLEARARNLLDDPDVGGVLLTIRLV